MKQLTLTIIGLVALVLIFAARVHATPSFNEAMIDLKQGNQSAGLAQLEELFVQTQSTNERAKAALILGLSKKKFLKKKRHHYADFTLTYAKGLTIEEQLRLLRIVGDGRFDEAKLKLAKRAFRKILNISQASFENKEYATYKLGWVELNLKRPDRAFNLWSNWTKKYKTGDLFESISQDMGKAWLEATQKKRKFKKSLSTNNSKPIVVTRGVLSGIRRANKISLLKVESKLRNSKVYTHTLNALLAEAGHFDRKPCDALKWIASANRTELITKTARATALHCARIDKANRYRKRLLALYPTLSLSGLNRWPYAKAKLQTRKEACSEYTKLISEIKFAKNPSVLPQVFDELTIACRRTPVALIPEIDALAKRVLSSKFLSQKAKQVSFLGPIARLFTIPAFKETGLNQIFIHQNLWKTSKLPIALVELFKNDEQLELAMLQMTRTPKLSQNHHTRVTYLVKKAVSLGNLDFAEGLLEDYYPIDSGLRSQTKKLWIALLLEKKEFSTITFHWFKFHRIIKKDSALAEQLLTSVIENPNNHRIAFEKNRNDSFFKYAKKAARVLDGTGSFNLKEVPRIIRKTKLHQDIKMMASIRRTETHYQNTSFKLGPKLASQLKRKMDYLKRRVLKAQSYVWGSKTTQNAAMESIKVSVNALAKAIESIEGVNQDNKEALSKIANDVRQWSS